tara:strand:- start:54086 stop:55840 length:1755 start_codon:yes stop_codon:yes gene_type:complete
MIDHISFIHQVHFWPVIIGGILLWLLFVWKEWSHVFKARFYLHSFVGLLAVVSLIMLALKPTIQKNASSTIGVLLTPDFNQYQLDSLKKNHKNLKIVPYSINQSIGNAKDSVGSFYILGKGLAAFDFWQLEKRPVKIIRGYYPKGITKLNYPSAAFVGDDVTVQGSYSEGKKGNRLVLSSPRGTGIDSIRLGGLVEENFKLTMHPNVVGKFKYALVEKDSLSTILSSEPLPLHIQERQSLKILMINNFPTFETKYLKNYLAEVGHQVTIRTQLTKNKFKYEYFNTAQQAFYNFTEKQLERFDLLFIDFESYLGLSRTDRSALDNSLKNNGLGLFIQPSVSFFNATPERSDFSFVTAESLKTSLGFAPEVLVDKFPYNFKPEFGLEQIHQDKDQTLTAYQRRVNGRVGTTVLQNTYELLLKGHKEVYEQFWAEVVTRLAKRNMATTEWLQSSKFAFQDEPFDFKIRTTVLNPEVLNTDQTQIPLRQDMDLVNNWYGTSFPRTLGWQQLYLKNDSLSTYDYYVMDTLNWKSLRAFQTLEANQRHFDGTTKKQKTVQFWAPINPFWFFLIFITAMGYLWLASKLFSK